MADVIVTLLRFICLSIAQYEIPIITLSGCRRQCWSHTVFVAAVGIVACGATFRLWPASVSAVPVNGAADAACAESAVTTGCAPWVAFEEDR